MVTSIFAVVSVAAGGGASLAAEEPEATRHAQVQLIAETAAAEPGSVVHLGVHFKIDPGWHVYWHGRNDSGGPIEVDLRLPPGFTAGPIQWPAPKRFVSEGDILDHVYEGEVVLIVPVRLPANAAGAAAFSGRVRYVICSSACVFEDAEVSLTIPIGSKEARPSPSAQAPLFESTRARLPREAPTGNSAPIIRRSGSRIDLLAPGAAAVAFFPDTDCIGLLDLVRNGAADQPRLSLRIDPEADQAAPVSGVLEVRYADTRGKVWYRLRERPQKDSSPPGAPGAGR